MKFHLPGLKADKRGVRCRLFSFLNQELDTLGCQSGGLDAVEGGRIASLLQMSQNGLSHIKEILALFLKKGAHKAGRIEWIDALVADHQSQAFALPKTGDHLIQVRPQVIQGNPFFVQIHSLGPRSQTAHQGQIATITSHHLHHKAATGGHR